MSRNIRLNDGSIYLVDRFGATDNRLQFRLITPGMTMLTAATVFGDAEKTSRVEHYFDGTDTDRIVYDGFTELIWLEKDSVGICAALEKNPGQAE